MKVTREMVLASLELASKFVADKTDHRRYLHHVCVKLAENALDFYIGASDGHKLVRIKLKNINPTELNFYAGLYDIQSVKNAIKINKLDIATFADNSVGTFPDYNRMIPDEPKIESAANINSDYLAKAFTAYTKFNKQVTGEKLACIEQVGISKDNANLWRKEYINIPVAVDIVIMPMRK